MNTSSLVMIEMCDSTVYLTLNFGLSMLVTKSYAIQYLFIQTAYLELELKIQFYTQSLCSI